MGIRLLNRIMKVRKLRPKLAAPPSVRRGISDKGKQYRRKLSAGLLLSRSSRLKAIPSQ